MLTQLKVLKRTREIIADESRWTRGTYARRPDGIGTNIDDDKACKFCFVGALRRAVFDLALLDLRMNPDDVRQSTASKAVPFAIYFDELRRHYVDAASTLGYLLEVSEDPCIYDHEDYIVAFNDDDDTTHAAVLTKLDEAINKLEE